MQLRDPGGSVWGEIIWELDLHNYVFLLYLHYCAFRGCFFWSFYFETLEPKLWWRSRDTDDTINTVCTAPGQQDRTRVVGASADTGVWQLTPAVFPAVNGS